MELYEVKDTLASEAYVRGRRDGKARLAPGLNPYPDGSAEHIEWERGRMSAVSEGLAPLNRKPCQYVKGLTCYCNGKATCLDAA